MQREVAGDTDVSTRIKAARLLRGMSQRELAARLVDAGLSGRTAGALERGELEVRATHLSALCEALKMPRRWFTADVDSLVSEEPDIALSVQLEGLSAQLDGILEMLTRWNSERGQF